MKYSSSPVYSSSPCQIRIIRFFCNAQATGSSPSKSRYDATHECQIREVLFFHLVVAFFPLHRGLRRSRSLSNRDRRKGCSVSDPFKPPSTEHRRNAMFACVTRRLETHLPNLVIIEHAAQVNLDRHGLRGPKQ